jgi:ribose 1,5-bisphosphate isomerase
MGINNFIQKRLEFNKIAQDIKEINIRGARNIAKKALYAYSLIPTKKSKKKLLSLRPTEPMLENVLKKIEKIPYPEILQHFDSAQKKINEFVLKIIENNDVIFTHCHSTNVLNALIYAKKKKKKFEVYNTESRPVFQGRKTSIDLSNAGIKSTQFVDSAAMIALTKSQGTKKVNKVFIGADALTKQGIINKVGSGMFSRIAYDNKIPVYIIADSWKFSEKQIPFEQRGLSEVWNKAPKHIKIKNPAFEFVPKKYITRIVSELGNLKYEDFLKKVKKINT